MSIESPRASMKLTSQEIAERDTLREAIEKEKAEGIQHGEFKVAILEKITNRLLDFERKQGEEDRYSYNSRTLGTEELTRQFRCKNQNDWEAMSSYLDSEVTVFQEMLVTQEGAQIIIRTNKDAEHQTYEISIV